MKKLSSEHTKLIPTREISMKNCIIKKKGVLSEFSGKKLTKLKILQCCSVLLQWDPDEEIVFR